MAQHLLYSVDSKPTIISTQKSVNTHRTQAAAVSEKCRDLSWHHFCCRWPDKQNQNVSPSICWWNTAVHCCSAQRLHQNTESSLSIHCCCSGIMSSKASSIPITVRAHSCWHSSSTVNSQCWRFTVATHGQHKVIWLCLFFHIEYWK